MKYTAKEAKEAAEKINSIRDNAVYKEVEREITKAVEKGLMEVTLYTSIPDRLRLYLIYILGYKVESVKISFNEYGTLISWK